jgi:hypothetical protein
VVPTKNPGGFDIDSDAIYWSQNEVGGTLLRLPFAGGAAVVLATSTQPIAAALVHGDDVYVLLGGSPSACMGNVLKVPRTGGAVQQISVGGTGMGSQRGSVAVDATYAYWLQIWPGDGWLLRAPTAGGNPEILETLQTLGKDLVVTTTDVYWTVQPSSGPSEIRAMQK